MILLGKNEYKSRCKFIVGNGNRAKIDNLEFKYRLVSQKYAFHQILLFVKNQN